LLLHSDGSLIEALGQDGSEELPWISTSIVISEVSSVKDTWYSSVVVMLVDLPLEAEGSVIVSNSGSGLL